MKEILKTISKEDIFEEIKIWKYNNKRNRTNIKIKFTFNKNTFKKSKNNTRRKRRKYDRFNRKNFRNNADKYSILKNS